MIFIRNLPKALIEGRFCVVTSCNQSQFSGCHDHNSNRLATSENDRMTEACLESESSTREILKVDNNELHEKFTKNSD